MRLIDANKLLNKSIIVENVNSTGRTKIMVDRNDIDNAPTIDAKPVVHGHWEKRYKSKYYRCSVCGGIVEDEWHNCPHCGAKMDEEGRQ